MDEAATAEATHKLSLWQVELWELTGNYGIKGWEAGPGVAAEVGRD